MSENSQSETKWEISSAKQRLYLDGDYSHWSLENHITFPSFTERQQGERGGAMRTRGQSLEDITFTRLLMRGRAV